MQDPRLWPQHYIDDILHRMRYRFSRFPARRRAAYAALLEVIRWREANLWPAESDPAMPEPGGLPPALRHPGVTPDGHA